MFCPHPAPCSRGSDGGGFLPIHCLAPRPEPPLQMCLRLWVFRPSTRRSGGAALRSAGAVARAVPWCPVALGGQQLLGHPGGKEVWHLISPVFSRKDET